MRRSAVFAQAGIQKLLVYKHGNPQVLFRRIIRGNMWGNIFIDRGEKFLLYRLEF